MEITLVKEDIEAIIKEKYDGVSEVKFNSKNIKATLVIKDITKFSLGKKKLPVNTEPAEQLPERTLEEKNEEAKKKGLMLAGGSERVLMKF